jgi:hypothetical protein
MVRQLPAILLVCLGCAATAYCQNGLNVVELTSDPANLVFKEDFTDANSLDRFVFSSPDHWRRVQVGDRWALEHVDAGAAYKPQYRSPLNIALIATQQCGSFVLDFEAQQTGREYGHRDACVFFNFVDPTHFYYAHVATQSDPHAHQIFTVNNAPRTKITQVGTAGFDWGPEDSWHQVRLVRDLQSGLIEVYVDQADKPIMRATDKSHAMGFVGFGSFDDTGRVTNIRLYSADSRQGRPGFFKGK